MELNDFIRKSIESALKHLDSSVGYGPRVEVSSIASAKAILVQIYDIMVEEKDKDSHGINPGHYCGNLGGNPGNDK